MCLKMAFVENKNTQELTREFSFIYFWIGLSERIQYIAQGFA